MCFNDTFCFSVGNFLIWRLYYNGCADGAGTILRYPVEQSLSIKIDSESVRYKKILVVEDIESNFAQLNILLKKEYIILWVRNGQEAINSFIREKPDLILMDIRMPVMDSIQAGCNAVFSKPYSLEKLKETIEIYIG